jgi:hypothetical protein
LTYHHIFGIIEVTTKYGEQMTNDENKVADKIGKLVSDLTLDIEQVGLYIGRQPNVILNRLEIITETAREEKEDLHITIDNDWR